MNEDESAFFPNRDQHIYERLGEEKKLVRMVERLTEENKYLKQLLKLQTKETHGKILDFRSINLQAKRLLKDTGSKLDRTELVHDLHDYYSDIIYGDNSRLGIKARNIATKLLNNVPSDKNTDPYIKDILFYIKKTPIKLDDVQKQEVASAYGSFDTYRKSMFGSAIISDNGTELDSVWQELAEVYPEYFDKEVNSADMPIVLDDIIHALREGSSLIEEYDQTEQIMYLAEQIYNTYWDVSHLYTATDKLSAEHRRELFKLNQAHKERVNKLNEKHEKEMQNLKQHHREMINRIRQESMNRAYDYKDKVDEARARAMRRNKTVRRNQILKFKDSLDARLLKDHKEKNIPLELQPWVCDLLLAINFDNVGAENRLKNIEDEMTKTKSPQVLNELQTGEITHILTAVYKKREDFIILPLQN